MNTFVYQMTNSGVYVFDGHTGILVDGLYGRGPYQCFSPFPGSMRRNLFEKTGLFGHLQVLLFTHAHGDHWDPDLLYYVEHNYDQVRVYDYAQMKNDDTEITRLNFRGLEIFLIDAVHEGRWEDPGFFNIRTCMVLLRNKEEQILLTSDAMIGEKETDILESFGILDLVFCNPLHLSTEQKRKQFYKMRFRRLVISHLPEPEDDIYGYWSMARQECRKISGDQVRPELPEQMKWLDDKYPDWISE